MHAFASVRRGLSTKGETMLDAPALGAAGWTRFERASGALFILLVSTLPLEWVVFGHTTLLGKYWALRYYLLAALAFMAVYLARYRSYRRLGLIVGRYRALYSPWICYLVVVAALSLTRAGAYATTKETAQQACYAIVSVFVAALFLDVDNRRIRRVLQWTVVATVSVVVAAIGWGLLGQGTNSLALIPEGLAAREPEVITLLERGTSPVMLVPEALAKGDPDVVKALLFLTFRSQGRVDAQANMRHRVFSAVLVGLAVTLICRERPRGAASRWRNRVLLVSAACAALLVVGSLSRAMILCMLIASGLYGLRMIIQSRANPRQLAAIFAVTAMLLVSPLGRLVEARLAQTVSYQVRIAALAAAVQPPSVGSVLLGWHSSEVARLPHNLIIDGWLSAGIVGAVTTALFLFAYFRVWLARTRCFLSGKERWTLSLHQFWMIAVGIIPLVRAVTAGGGLHLTDWVCIGIVLGLVEANRRATDASAPERI